MERTCQIFDLTDRPNPLIREAIKRRLGEIENMPNIVRYKLNNPAERVLKGSYGVLMRLIVERGTHCRQPILMASLHTPYDDNQFNFTKVQPEERLMDLRLKDIEVAIIANVSPYTKFHCLIIPGLHDRQPQVLTLNAIMFSIRFLKSLDSYEHKIGYNSSGGSGSVNHLHLHLIHLEYEIFAQRAELTKIRSGIYCFNQEYEIKAFCFLLRRLSDDEHESEVAEKVYKLVRYMIDNGIPHNLFFTLAKHKEERVMRIIVYPRDKMCALKSTTDLNIAFCELSGFLPLSNEKHFTQLTEAELLEAIKDQQCDAFDRLLVKVKDSAFYPHTRPRLSTVANMRDDY
ncbi:GDP-D-glucose phosphorylase 1-like isoform X2 [Hermetia illucens]|uniref:GDP-D-glucose phosphorylase 1-like isoform X2 n=1 Tax=Hermetia illucens TaxID=343691 RepID=UPI0018CC623B|nr:GDP-D-glucose phosphorylase 1-like isoform X2 [Hermetia illucens]